MTSPLRAEIDRLDAAMQDGNLQEFQRWFARLTLMAGAFVEWGGSPVALAEYAPSSAMRVMACRMAFSRRWPEVSGGRPEPDPDQPPSMDEIIGLFKDAARQRNQPERNAIEIAVSWFDVGHWVNLMITCLGRREFRDATELMPQLGEGGRALAGSVPRAHWLDGLTAVLDDEPLVVIDHATGRGYRLTMSGVGDNFQFAHPARGPADRRPSTGSGGR